MTYSKEETSLVPKLLLEGLCVNRRVTEMNRCCLGWQSLCVARQIESFLGEHGGLGLSTGRAWMLWFAEAQKDSRTGRRKDVQDMLQ